MITRYTHNGLLWIDVESPTKEDILSLSHEFHIHPLIEGELIAPSLRPKVDMHRDAIYLILHFPAVRHTHTKGRKQEVDFVIGKNYLMTVHYDTIDAIYKFSKEFEVNSILDKHHIGDHAGFLFFHLIRKLYRSLEHELEHIDDRLEKAEAKIFHGGEDKMVEVLSKISRDLLDFKQAIRTHHDVLKSLETAGKKFFGEDFTFYLESVTGEYYKVANALDGHKETLIGLRETNDSLLTTKTGKIMKRLTFVSFTTFPPMLIASLFGMNALHTPFMGKPFDFWIVLGIMFASTLTIVLFFHHKKWL